MNSRDKNNMRVQNCGSWLRDYLRIRSISRPDLDQIITQIELEGLEADIGDLDFSIEDKTNPLLSNVLVALRAFKRAQVHVASAGGEEADIDTMEHAVEALSRQPLFEMSTRNINDKRVRNCASTLQRRMYSNASLHGSDLLHAVVSIQTEGLKADLSGLKIDATDVSDERYTVIVEALAAFRRVQTCIRDGVNEDEAVLDMQQIIEPLRSKNRLQGVPLQDVRGQLPIAKL